MTDRRVDVSKNTQYNSRIHDLETDACLGFTIDISATGLRMLSIHSFTPGEALDLRVELPHEIRRIVSIKLRAVVKWCQGDVNPDFMDIGLDLIDTPEDLAIVLADIQRLYCFDE